MNGSRHKRYLFKRCREGCEETRPFIKDAVPVSSAQIDCRKHVSFLYLRQKVNKDGKLISLPLEAFVL